ncbi:C40 family peptidase [Streptomyces sp. ISL-11]|uniref:C40 family peptidase n=1 Tax=Streptomyces sp. ISL-11 TaxID=2819174 RepID=UPI001BEAB35C|nr:NlpC/P60 family protein [Streptomyces sp. ISL-11]MBT2382311.1 C40 family peptidase [Streptomyces sp. ISL-11]
MSRKTKDRKKQGPSRRRAVHTLVVLGLLGASAYLTVELRDKQPDAAPPVRSVGGSAPTAGAKAMTGERRYERLASPARTVVRAADGSVLATLTDGARTAVLTGPSRTFTEPKYTSAKVTTDSWVRLLPQAWKEGSEKAAWFTEWFGAYLGSKEPDVLAFSMDYLEGAPQKKDVRGLAYAGDAQFGPVNPKGSEAGDMRLEQSDFYDYLGIPYTFRDGTVERPEAQRLRSMDCSGFVRTVFGYRARYPLMGKDVKGDGLPRTADGMARLSPGVPVLELTGKRPEATDRLQPGDLVFFEIDKRTGERLDHVGIYLGLDTDGKPRFISSREEANGPTFGDKGGTARLDGNGFYAAGLRSAKRL